MSVLSALPRGEKIEFPRLRSLIKATQGNLGAHLATLEQAGYIQVEKDFDGKKPRTRICLTAAGRHAFKEHIAYLREVVRGVDDSEEA